jgi:hypothetical protein
VLVAQHALVLPELPDHLAPQGQQDQRAIQAPRQNPNSKALVIGRLSWRPSQPDWQAVTTKAAVSFVIELLHDDGDVTLNRNAVARLNPRAGTNVGR